AAFALHFDDLRDGAPDVRLALGRPLVAPFAHRRRRSDRINCDNFIDLVGHVSRGFVAVDRYFRSSHVGIHSSRKSPYENVRHARPRGKTFGLVSCSLEYRFAIENFTPQQTKYQFGTSTILPGNARAGSDT